MCIFSILASTGAGNIGFAKSEAKRDSKTENYIVQFKNVDTYKEQKKKLKKNDKIVINHKKADEKYLETSQTITAELSSEEVKEYAKESGVVVEKDYSVSGSNTDVAEEFLMEVASEEPVQMPKTTEEYSDNPYNFEPCEAVTDEEKKNEVVPWNIECVAGTPSANKYKGKHIKVAVIDSGIDTHNELNTKDWVDFSDKVEGYKPIDNNGHGTSMAGVIAARVNGIGIEGIASEAELYSVKILDEENTAAVSTVIKALEWCMDNDIDIVNMSFGMDQYSSILADVIKKAYDKGVLIIAAGGNNTKEVQYPAAYPEVISVGSINENLEASEFSNNANVDLVAPGENVQTLGYLGSFSIANGTSIATAHVTGVAAAVKSAKKNISNDVLKNALISSAVSLEDGSKLINYESAVDGLKKKNHKKPGLNKLKKEVLATAEDEETYVEGSWSQNLWLNQVESTGTGHMSLINKMSISYFGNSSETDTAKTTNRTIVANACFKTDNLARMSASGIGNEARNSNGEIVENGSPKCYSPYHGKSEYTMNEVAQHLFFLYELARRRLVLNASLDLVATNYNGNTYHGLYIGQKMKRRIVADLKALYDNQVQAFNGQIDMNTTRHKGYMVLGVFLHLVQDIQAHRAEVTYDMVFRKDMGSYYSEAVFGKTAQESKVCGLHIDRVALNDFNVYYILYDRLNGGKTMPMIRLKDYLIQTTEYTRFTITCNGEKCVVTEGQAYEDNPYFYSDRYDSAVWFSWAYIDRMMKDTSTGDGTINSYYATDSVPIYRNTYEKF